MLLDVYLLYLGCTVLILLDAQYIGKFWPLFESWLSVTTTSERGLVPDEPIDPSSIEARFARCRIKTIDHSGEALVRALYEDNIQKHRTVFDACKWLAQPVIISLFKDKGQQLVKLVEVDEQVRAAKVPASSRGTAASSGAPGSDSPQPVTMRLKLSVLNGFPLPELPFELLPSRAMRIELAHEAERRIHDRARASPAMEMVIEQLAQAPREPSQHDKNAENVAAPAEAPAGDALSAVDVAAPASRRSHNRRTRRAVLCLTATALVVAWLVAQAVLGIMLMPLLRWQSRAGAPMLPWTEPLSRVLLARLLSYVGGAPALLGLLFGFGWLGICAGTHSQQPVLHSQHVAVRLAALGCLAACCAHAVGAGLWLAERYALAPRLDSTHYCACLRSSGMHARACAPEARGCAVGHPLYDALAPCASPLPPSQGEEVPPSPPPAFAPTCEATYGPVPSSVLPSALPSALPWTPAVLPGATALVELLLLLLCCSARPCSAATSGREDDACAAPHKEFDEQQLMVETTTVLPSPHQPEVVQVLVERPAEASTSEPPSRSAEQEDTDGASERRAAAASARLGHHRV